MPANCNNNGRMEWGPSDKGADSEVSRAWSHLPIAGLLTEYYISYLDNGGNAIPCLSLPATKYQSVDGLPIYWAFNGFDSNLNLASRNPGSGGYNPHMDAFAPADGYLIDLKIDDGVGNTGIVQAGVPKTAASNGAAWGGGCRVDYDGANWTIPTQSGPLWQINNTGAGCALQMKLGKVTGDPRSIQ